MGDIDFSTIWAEEGEEGREKGGEGVGGVVPENCALSEVCDDVRGREVEEVEGESAGQSLVEGDQRGGVDGEGVRREEGEAVSCARSLASSWCELLSHLTRGVSLHLVRHAGASPDGCDQLDCDSLHLQLMGVACYHDYQTQCRYSTSGAWQDVQLTPLVFCPCLMHCELTPDLCCHYSFHC